MKAHLFNEETCKKLTKTIYPEMRDAGELELLYFLPPRMFGSDVEVEKIAFNVHTKDGFRVPPYFIRFFSFEEE